MAKEMVGLQGTSAGGVTVLVAFDIPTGEILSDPVGGGNLVITPSSGLPAVATAKLDGDTVSGMDVGTHAYLTFSFHPPETYSAGQLKGRALEKADSKIASWVEDYGRTYKWYGAYVADLES